MSGVQTGSRLDRLQQLQRRTRHQLAAARRRDDRPEATRLLRLDRRLAEEIAHELSPPPPEPTTPGTPRLRSQKVGDRVTRRLDQLGVTAHDVKEWAVTAGLVDRVRRGRIRAELVEAYANRNTHPKEPTR